MKLWYDYRQAWSLAPWLWPIALAGLILLVGGVVGTALRSVSELLFVPGLLLLFAHHFLALRKLE